MPEKSKPAPERIYLIGICGTAMASLAYLLKAAGYTVTGSDAGIYPPMSTYLKQNGIRLLQGYDPANLQPRPDLVVVGNAISRGNAELERTLETKIPYASLPETLRLRFLPGKTSVVVSGTHGKTTTSSILAWAFSELGEDPSFLIGGIPAGLGGGARLGKGPWFVLEGDEYDTAYFDKAPKFFHYRPDLLVVNNVEYDHADIYPDLESILLQFRRLVNLVPRNGLIVYGGDCPNARAVTARAFCPTVSVGLSEGCDWRVEVLGADVDGTRIRVRRRGEALGQLTTPLHGDHNVRNLAAAAAVLDHAGFAWDRAARALSSFAGVERRMTLRAEVGEVLIYDDFAHHPTAIRETLAGVRRRFPGRRIWAVFEPRSWTCRKKVHQEAMPFAFTGADVVILAEVFRKEQLPETDRFRPEIAVEALNASGGQAYYIPDGDAIADFLARETRPGDVVVVMSNGGFDDIHRKLAERIKTNHDA